MMDTHLSSLPSEDLSSISIFSPSVEHAIQLHAPRHFHRLCTQVNLSVPLDTLMQTLRRILPYFVPLKPSLKSYCYMVIFYHLHHDRALSIRDAYHRIGTHFQSEEWIRLRRFLNDTSSHVPAATLFQSYVTELQTTFALTESHVQTISNLSHRSCIRRFALRSRIGAAFLYFVGEYHIPSISVYDIMRWARCSYSTLYGIRNLLRTNISSVTVGNVSSSPN